MSSRFHTIYDATLAMWDRVPWGGSGVGQGGLKITDPRIRVWPDTRYPMRLDTYVLSVLNCMVEAEDDHMLDLFENRIESTYGVIPIIPVVQALLTTHPSVVVGDVLRTDEQKAHYRFSRYGYNKLCLTVSYGSVDTWKDAPYIMFRDCTVLQTVANLAGIGTGSYFIYSDRFHAGKKGEEAPRLYENPGSKKNLDRFRTKRTPYFDVTVLPDDFKQLPWIADCLRVLQRCMVVETTPFANPDMAAAWGVYVG